MLPSPHTDLYSAVHFIPDRQRGTPILYLALPHAPLTPHGHWFSNLGHRSTRLSVSLPNNLLLLKYLFLYFCLVGCFLRGFWWWWSIQTCDSTPPPLQSEAGNTQCFCHYARYKVLVFSIISRRANDRSKSLTGGGHTDLYSAVHFIPDRQRGTPILYLAVPHAPLTPHGHWFSNLGHRSTRLSVSLHSVSVHELVYKPGVEIRRNVHMLCSSCLLVYSSSFCLSQWVMLIMTKI